MNIFDIFKSKAEVKNANLGIGLGQTEEHNIKILRASLQFLNEFNSNIYLFGNETSINHIIKNEIYKSKNLSINLIKSNNPEQKIVKYLRTEKIDSIVRGSLNSSLFLNAVKIIFNAPIINRMALLETYRGFQFFYGPVGIDECNNFDKKVSFIKKAINVFQSLKIKPIISILSGGRKDDLGRDPQVDNTINDAKNVIEYFKKENANLNISHDEILIENAIKNKSNLIIAPDGISGNLIYRTLVHLGGGKAYGAIYMDIEKPIIDTSRVGKLSEIYGALLLSLSLTP